MYSELDDSFIWISFLSNDIKSTVQFAQFLPILHTALFCSGERSQDSHYTQ